MGVRDILQEIVLGASLMYAPFVEAQEEDASTDFLDNTEFHLMHNFHLDDDIEGRTLEITNQYEILNLRIKGLDVGMHVENQAELLAARLNITEATVGQSYGIFTLFGADHTIFTPYEAFITHLYIGPVVVGLGLYDRVQEVHEDEEFSIAGFQVPIDQTGDVDFLLVELGLKIYENQWDCFRLDASARFAGGIFLETLLNKDEDGNLVGGGGDPLIIGGIMGRVYARCDFDYLTDFPFVRSMSLGGDISIGYLNIIDGALEMLTTLGDIVLGVNFYLGFSKDF